jgi:DNA-directed RNA polymerase subunit RPC12/RpoP
LGESLHVCNYTGCGRAFDNPVLLTDLSRKPNSDTYYACPYCFSRVNEADYSGHYEVEAAGDMKNLKSETQKEPIATANDMQCPHYMGYLKTRPKNEPVRDCCLTCPQILQCMV